MRILIRMKQSLPSAQLRTAIEYLEQRATRAEPGTTLPPAADMAREAGVAYVTMWKALDRLRNQGILRARPRRGITVVRRPGPALSVPSEQTVADPTSRRKWARTTSAIRRDLLEGFYAPATPLPSRKELTERYGVCVATLSKALSELVADGSLRQERTRFMPPPPRQSTLRNTVMLVACGDYDGTPALVHARTPEHIRALEYECSLRNVGLQFVPVDPRSGGLHDPGLSHRLRTDIHYRDAILGVLIWQAGMDHRPWTDLVLEFAPLGKPIALLDETGEYAVPRIAGAQRQIRHFTMGFSEEAGRRMGVHLLALNHRRVAFVSPVHRAAWSRNRLQGLRDAFARAGLADAVVEYVLDEHSLPSEFLSLCTDVRTQLRAQLGHSPDVPSGSLAARARQAIDQALDPILMREAYAMAMAPLMESALADTRITAWVAADDDTALPCLAFLRERGVKVPDRLSVAGFDDGVGSSLQKLTSYNYNGSAYMRAMLAHVLAPGSPESGGPAHGPIELAGTVVQRRTTAVTRQAG